MNDNIKFDIFIKGKLIDLVVLDEKAAEKSNWYNWFNDEEVTKYMVKHYYPNTKTLQINFYKNGELSKLWKRNMLFNETKGF